MSIHSLISKHGISLFGASTHIASVLQSVAYWQYMLFVGNTFVSYKEILLSKAVIFSHFGAKIGKDLGHFWLGYIRMLGHL